MRDSLASPTPEQVADLFDAALDPAKWDLFAHSIAEIVGLDGAAVVIAKGSQVLSMSVTDCIAQGLSDYQSYYHQFDPWRHKAQTVRPNSVVLSSELLPESDLVRTAFFNDYARHLGMYRPMNAYIPLDSQTVVAVGVEQYFSKKLLEEEDKHRLATLLPFITRALQLRRRFHSGLSEQALTIEALNRLAMGIVICDAAGRIAFVNSAAEVLSQRSKGAVSLTRKTVATIRSEQSQKLARLIASAAAGGSGGAVALSSIDGSELVLALVSPLPRSLKEEWGGHALIALRRPAEEAEIPVQALSQLFGLSPSQGKLALALYNGSTVEEFAEAKGIKVSTVRSHLAEALAKTGTGNQRDLVRLIGMLPPLRAGL